MQAAEQAGNQAAGQAAGGTAGQTAGTGPALDAGAGAAGAGTTPAATPSLPSDLQTLGETASWQTIAIAAAAVVIIIALVLLVLWWRKRRAQEPAPAVPRPDLSLQLARIWKPFYDRIPRRAHHYPTVVVLGDAGAGKSCLIDNRVDWRGQASELQPSQTGHSAMQLYLGPGVVVHELSAPLLRDVSREAGRALGHLWRRLGRQPVTAVLVVDVRSLSDTTPAALHELAHLVRGKLSILSGRGKRSVSLRLCLTHMDKVAGYVDLTRLLRKHGAGMDALRPERRGQAGDQAGDGGFGRMEGWLSAALVECDPEAFARVVSLYRQAPAIERALAPLVRTLEGEDDAFAARYPLQGSYLSGLAASDHVGDPMAVDRSTVAASMARERRRHLVACGAAATVWAVLLTALFGWHSARLRDAERAVAVFDNTAATSAFVSGSTPSLRAELDAARREADTSLDRLAASEVLGLGRTFQPRKQRVDARYLDSLRRGYILPATTSRDRVRLLYAVSLLYAARDTDMGILIQGQPATWAGALTMPERVITEYVQRSHGPWPELVTLPDDLQGTATTSAPEDWQALLTTLERMLARATITPAQLADAQAQVPALHQGEQYTTLARAAELLGQDPLLRTQLAAVIDPWPASAWVDENSDALASVSAMVRRAHLEVSDMAGASLSDLADELVRLGQESQPAAQTYSFTLDDDPAGDPTGDDPAGNTPDTKIVIDTAAWAALVQRSRARLLVDAFLTDVQDSERSPFFRARARYADTGVLAGTRQGPTEVIRGIYTQAVYAAQVAPALRALGEERMAALPLAAGDRDELYAYVQSSIDAYAAAYAGELAAYYDSFTFGVSSVDALIFELQALGQPTSWFVAFLRHVARNAALAEEENELFQVLNDYLTPFQPLVALAAEADGKMPQLEPYFTEIITPLLQALEGQAASGGASGSAPADGAAEPGGLDLSTAGALALAALQGQGEDYAAKTRAWLGTVNIVGSQQRPFLRPVQAAYALGQSNIEEAMSAAWQDQLLPQIAPVLAQFPFRRTAADEADADALEALLLPEKGSFWQSFSQTVATACVAQNGTWRALSPLRAPADMLATVNDLARLSRTLWDADGKRTPLALRLTPLPLPARAVTGRYAVLAYLTAGRASLYAFNQKPESQDLSLQWWAQDAASVGVQLDTPEAGSAQRSTKYRSIEVSDSAWAFYRLLERATMHRQRVALWQVPVSDSAHGKVRFRLDTDPWAPFQVRSDP